MLAIIHQFPLTVQSSVSSDCFMVLVTCWLMCTQNLNTFLTLNSSNFLSKHSLPVKVMLLV